MWRPARTPGVAAEDLGLDGHGGVLEAVEHRLVVVDDLLDDGGEHRRRAEGEVLGIAGQVVAEVAQRAGLPVAHADDEVLPEQHRHLAELRLLGGGVVAGGAQHEGRGVVLDGEHRPLVGPQHLVDLGLLDAEAVEGVAQLLGRRHAQAQPHEGARVPSRALAPASRSSVPVTRFPSR